MFNDLEKAHLNSRIDRLEKQIVGSACDDGILSECSVITEKCARLSGDVELLLDYLGVERISQPNVVLVRKEKKAK